MRTPIALTSGILSLLLLFTVLGCGSSDKQNASQQDKDNLEQFVDGKTGDPHTGMGGDQSAMPKDAVHGGAMAGMVAVGPLAGKLPDGWIAVQPASSMRQAEYQLEPVGDDPNQASVAVFYFGENAGTVDMNLSRWRGQFTHADGSPLSVADVNTQTFTANGMDVSMISFTGTQKPSNMPGAPSTPDLPGWMNISAIVMTPQGPWFFKGTGPEATMKAHAERFKKMISSLEYSMMDAHG